MWFSLDNKKREKKRNESLRTKNSDWEGKKKIIMKGFWALPRSWCARKNWQCSFVSYIYFLENSTYLYFLSSLFFPFPINFSFVKKKTNLIVIGSFYSYNNADWYRFCFLSTENDHDYDLRRSISGHIDLHCRSISSVILNGRRRIERQIKECERERERAIDR